MHYINGREAKEWDPVIVRRYGGKISVGVLHSINEAALTCNGQVAIIVPGGVSQSSVTIGNDCLHAEDGFVAAIAMVTTPSL